MAKYVSSLPFSKRAYLLGSFLINRIKVKMNPFQNELNLVITYGLILTKWYKNNRNLFFSGSALRNPLHFSPPPGRCHHLTCCDFEQAA